MPCEQTRNERSHFLHTDPTQQPSANPTVSLSPTDHPTAEPTIEPTVEPTTDPTSDPTSDPTTDPTSDPIMDPTMVPTADPTIGDGEEYGIVVIVAVNDTDTDIPLILNNIASDLVSDIIDNTCSKGTSTERDENDETQLVITIRVCDESSEDILLTAIKDNDLLSDKINEQGIDAEIVGITTINTYPEDGNGNGNGSDSEFRNDGSGLDTMDIIIIVIVSSFICLILISCGVAYKIRRDKERKSHEQKHILSDSVLVVSPENEVNTNGTRMYKNNETEGNDTIVMKNQIDGSLDDDTTPTIEMEDLNDDSDDFVVKTKGNDEDDDSDDFVVATKGNDEEDDIDNVQNLDEDDIEVMGDVNETHGNLKDDEAEFVANDIDNMYTMK